MEILEIILWCLRAVGFILIAVFAMPRVWKEFKRTENGVRADRWVMIGVFHVILAWIVLGPLVHCGWIQLPLAIYLSSIASLCVGLGFFIIVFRPQIRDFLHRIQGE